MRPFPLALIHLAVTALSLTLLGESTAAEPIQATIPPPTLTAQALPATLPLVNTIKIWNRQTGQLLRTLTSDHFGRSAAISSDGKLLASANDQSTRIWRLPPIKQLVSSAASAAPTPKCPNNAAGASSTTRASTQTSKNPRQAQLLHAFKNSSIAPSSVTLNATSLTLSDNNRLLATVGNFIRTWDLKSGKQLCTFAQNGSKVSAAIFTPKTGQTLITGHDDSLIKLWNSRTGQQLRTFAGHTDAVKTLAITPDGQRLVSSSLDGTVKIWNLQTGQLLRTLSDRFSGQNGAVLAVSRDGQTLATADDKALKLWNLQTGQVLRTVVQESSIASVTFSADGQTLISSNTSDDTIKVWHPRTGKLIRSVKGNESKGLDAYYLTISPDGQTFMVTMLKFSLEASAPAMFFELRNLATSQQISLPDIGSACSGAGLFAFAPDGKTFACSQADDIQIWHMPS